MKHTLPPRYDPQKIEGEIYTLWEKFGYFNPDKLPKTSSGDGKKKPFTVIMPPPNANGSLHIGHAVFVTLQDIMIRYWRMRGRHALWLPGADHAGFETQVVFDKKLEKEGRNRFKIPRDKLWNEMHSFTMENKKTMEHQLRKLGASCDWSREKFTLDQDIIRETQKTFVKMYKDGLVYRKNRLVNWCVKHQTALSDLEVGHTEQKDPLYYLRYGKITVATVRPEPIFADVAIAVHPKDKRYKHLIGKNACVPISGREIPIIADYDVDPQFGTGAVKVTPSVDHSDFERAERHNLPTISIINRYGVMTEEAKKYKGMKVLEAREAIVKDLVKGGYIERVDEEYTHAVSTCYKCKRILEPLLLPQWYITMQPLRDKAVRAVKSGKIVIHPDKYRKIFFHWMDNIEDWNVSRQIVWGIRIPAWRCGCENEKWKVQTTQPKKRCTLCKKAWIQDPDVFDTWFSSGQWPYLTLGFKDSGSHRKDFMKHYPTDVLETAYDIFFFWVARMIMMGLYRTGKVPFRTVYLHGLVRDKDKQKMSKSKGNVIDPLGVAEEYGTDAMRMALVVGNTAGNDIVISEEKIRGYRNFATKVWNIARFVLMQEASPSRKKVLPSSADKRRIAELSAIHKRVSGYLESYKFHLAGETIYHYIWHTLADTVIEEMKPRLASDDDKDRASAIFTLRELLLGSIEILHPFMPFITEAIYQEIIKNSKENKKNLAKMLMIQTY
jgi:valyl-tRNA synthetase